MNKKVLPASYDPLLLRLGFLILAVFLSLHFALAQDRSAANPEPAPTDAVKQSGQRVRLTGQADLKQGLASSRYAALLDGYAQTLKHGLEQGLFTGNLSQDDGEFRFFTIDSDHPAPDVASWVFRSKVVDEKDREGFKVLTLESPELGSVATAQPVMRATMTKDVDMDGLSDVVSVGYDGSIYVSTSPRGAESKIVSRSDSYAVLEIVTGPGFERVRAVIPQEVATVDVVSPGEARALLVLENLEMVNGKLMGHSVEQREVLVSLGKRVERIRFNLSEPPDFSRLYDPKIELRGSTLSEESLDDVVVRHNGKVAWQSPEGIGTRALQFNLTADLVPGWNSFRMTARDAEGFSSVRELWVEGPADELPTSRAGKRAVIVTLDNDFKDDSLNDLLGRVGFSRDKVTVLKEKQATSQAVLEAIRDSRGGDELLLYLESYSEPGSPIGGKTLRLIDGSILPSDLARAMDAGNYSKVVGLAYTEIPRESREAARTNALWLDTAVFLDRLGDSGRLFLANIEDPEESPRRARSRSRDRLLEALKKTAGSDLVRLVDLKRPTDTLFRGWVYGRSMLGS